MKKSLLIASMLFSLWTNAAIFYISTNGNDNTGTGSLSQPWKTLSKATSTVTIAGNIIHVNSGTYLETVQCFLSPGVSLEGDGVTSVIQSTWPWSFQGALVLSSNEGTNGNQYISFLKFDGRSMTTPRGIQIYGRSNINFHHCTIVDFKEEGIIISGTVGYTGFAPAIFATGISFHDNIVSNCSQFSGYGTGCLGVGGTQGMLIYNNTITQLNRIGSFIGWPIKYFNEGWNNGMKIYNNTIIKSPFDGNGFDFALELFNQSGMEIYGNTIQGALDFNFQTKGSYPYSIYIHDNTVSQSVLNTHTEDAIIVEYSAEGVWVKKNIFRNLTVGLVFYTRPNGVIKDVELEQNLFDNFGRTIDNGGSFAGGFGVGATSYFIDGFRVWNNTMTGLPNSKVDVGIGLGDLQSGHIKNVDIRNNHFSNIVVSCLKIGGSVTPDSINFSNNNTYNTDQYGVSSNLPYFTCPTPTHLIQANNIHNLPLFIDTIICKLQPSSSLVDAGISVGLPYTGIRPNIGYDEVLSDSAIIPISDLSVVYVNPTPTSTGIVPYEVYVEFNKDIKSVSTYKITKTMSGLPSSIKIVGKRIYIQSSSLLALDTPYIVSLRGIVATDNTTMSVYNFSIIRTAKIYKY